MYGNIKSEIKKDDLQSARGASAGYPAHSGKYPGTGYGAALRIYRNGASI